MVVHAYGGVPIKMHGSKSSFTLAAFAMDFQGSSFIFNKGLSFIGWWSEDRQLTALLFFRTIQLFSCLHIIVATFALDFWPAEDLSWFNEDLLESFAIRKPPSVIVETKILACDASRLCAGPYSICEGASVQGGGRSPTVKEHLSRKQSSKFACWMFPVTRTRLFWCNEKWTFLAVLVRQISVYEFPPFLGDDGGIGAETSPPAADGDGGSPGQVPPVSGDFFWAPPPPPEFARRQRRR